MKTIVQVLLYVGLCVSLSTTNVVAKTFNVIDYGAKGDDKTDNTAAFSACIKAIIDAGGGRMYIPDGVYRGRIIVPGTKKWITLEIVGESKPTPIFGTIGSFPLPKNGTILKCLSKSGPAVISAANTPEKLYMTFSGVNAIIRNLDVRTYDNPGVSGIDLKHAAQCKIENVFVNTDVYNVQASKPIHGTSGVITPACNNGAWTVLRNVVVTGYHTGIMVNEHTDGDSIVVASNINGLEFLQAHHASRFARVGTYRNTHQVTVSGRHGFSIDQLNTEMPGRGQTNAGNAWQTLVSDINDPKNLGIGDINYWVVEGNVGAVEKFTRNGGEHIRARRIGSPPVAKPTHETMMNPAQQSPADDVLKVAPEELPVKEVRVVLPGEDSEQMKRIASVFARQVEERCSAKVTTQREAPLTVTLKVDPAIGKDGFRIKDRAAGVIEVIGQNERGVLYGLGKLLRTSRYSDDGFAAGKWRGESVPQKPIRGIYFATHFHNFYHDAPVEKIQRYVEDLALWGFNSLVVWYDMHHFNGFDDPEAVAFRARLRAILLAAKRIGMDVWLGVVGNEAYGNSPAEIRAAPGGGRGAIFASDVCPSKPEGMQYILKVLGEEFDWAADLKPRSMWIWPYDSGGCGCAECQPWGSKGFMKCVKEVGKLAREKMPGTKIFLSTWFIKGSEWSGIKEQLARDKGLVDGIVSEPGPHGLAIAPEDHGLPMIGFPEISMHGTFPWGGFGATPLTARARKKWDSVKKTHAGGFPYSEGIYEDLTKVVYSQLYWSDRPVEETVKEYIAFEFSPDVVEDVAEVIKTLDHNHHWRWWPGKLEGVKLGMNWFPSRGAKPQADPGADQARLACAIRAEQGNELALGQFETGVVHQRRIASAEGEVFNTEISHFRPASAWRSRRRPAPRSMPPRRRASIRPKLVAGV